jgi:hypothetical protein
MIDRTTPALERQKFMTIGQRAPQTGRTIHPAKGPARFPAFARTKRTQKMTGF